MMKRSDTLHNDLKKETEVNAGHMVPSLGRRLNLASFNKIQKQVMLQVGFSFSETLFNVSTNLNKVSEIKFLNKVSENEHTICSVTCFVFY